MEIFIEVRFRDHQKTVEIKFALHLCFAKNYLELQKCDTTLTQSKTKTIYKYWSFLNFIPRKRWISKFREIIEIITSLFLFSQADCLKRMIWNRSMFFSISNCSSSLFWKRRIFDWNVLEQMASEKMKNFFIHFWRVW